MEPARARVTPIRREPFTSGFPKRRRCVIRLCQCLVEPAESRLRGSALHEQRTRGRRPELTDRRDRQLQNGPCVQRKLRQILRNESDEPGIVRPRTDFGKNHVVALDRQLHAEQTAAAERIGDGF